MATTLILTVTRACNLRCAYCPTVKQGWPELTPEQTREALKLFVDRFGGGDVKLFGGEPLLNEAAVDAALDLAESMPGIRRIQLSTNGLGLTPDRLADLRARKKAVLVVSIDGKARDHRRLRRQLPGVPDAYEHVMELVPELVAMRRMVVTQTIAPATAKDAHQNFEHLLSLGFRRVNLLPGYYLPWREEQLAALSEGFDAIGRTIRERWAAQRYFYLRNLTTWAPTPFFNTGMVVDADATIHPSNVGLSGSLESLLEETRVGTLAEPPSRAELDAAAERVPGLLKASLSEHVWSSTQAVDAELTRLCRSLFGPFAAYRASRGRAA